PPGAIGFVLPEIVHEEGVLHGLTACCLFFGCCFFFVVFLFRIDRPDIGFLGDTGGDIVDGYHGGEHGMVGIVVFVHAVAADQEEIFEGIGIGADLVELVIGAEIGGVGLFHAADRAVEDVFFLRQVHFF